MTLIVKGVESPFGKEETKMPRKVITDDTARQNEELRDLLIAISVVAKRLATKIEEQQKGEDQCMHKTKDSAD